MPGERAGGGRTGERRQQRLQGCQTVEPGGVAKTGGPEGCGLAVGAPEEGLSAGRLRPTAGPDAAEAPPRGCLLPERLLLSPVKEGSRHQLRKSLQLVPYFLLTYPEFFKLQYVLGMLIDYGRID